jgi:hypothetical protein
VANGTLELPDALGCNSEATQRWCLYGNNAITPALTSPVNIKPFPAWYPRVPYEYPDRCVERSDYPRWEIRDFLYDHRKGAQSVSFTIRNVMNGAVQTCLMDINETSTRADDHTTRWATCTKTPDVVDGVEATQILFDHDYGLFGVKQTWKCRDNVASNDEPYVSP